MFLRRSCTRTACTVIDENHIQVAGTGINKFKMHHAHAYTIANPLSSFFSQTTNFLFPYLYFLACLPLFPLPKYFCSHLQKANFLLALSRYSPLIFRGPQTFVPYSILNPLFFCVENIYLYTIVPLPPPFLLD